MKVRWCVLLIALLASQGVNADGKAPNDATAPAGATAAKDPNDPNGLLWKKWDVVIKDPNDPNDVLWTKWCAVVKVLQAKGIDKEAKAKIIDKIITPIFDFPLMARLVVRKHWSKFTPPQREKFTRLFTKRLKTSYRDKISLYTDERASLKPALRKKKTIIHIPMEMVSKDKKIAILYKLRKGAKGWKIYDVEVQGVSIILTYMSQFNDILRRGAVEDLISRMEQPQTR